VGPKKTGLGQRGGDFGFSRWKVGCERRM